MALAITLGVGIGAAWPHPEAAGWLAAAAALTGVIAVLSPVRFAALCLFALLAGAAVSSLRSSVPQGEPSPHGPLSGIVSAPPTRAPTGCRLRLRHVQRQHRRRWGPPIALLTLELGGPCPRTQIGDRVQVRARIWPPTATRPARARVPHGGLVRLARAQPPEQPELLDRLKSAVIGQIAPWKSPGRTLLTAVIAGDRQWMTPGDRGPFRTTGTAHLLAISGLHVGLVVALCFWGVRRAWALVPSLALRMAPSRVAAGAGLLVAWGFVLFSGAATPAVRAGIMASAMLVGHLCVRKTDPWAALALAGIAILLWDPTQLTLPGCQLSFAAVAGILLITPPSSPSRLTPSDDDRPRRSRPVQWLWVTAAATLATLPLTAYHFGQVTAVGLLLNLAVIPLLCGVAIPVGLTGAALAMIAPSLGQPLLTLAAGSAELTLGLVAWGDAQLAPTFTVAFRTTAFQTLMTYAALLGLWLVRRRLGRALLIIAAWGWLASAGVGLLGPSGGTGLRIVFMNVGKGDAALITFPDGTHALIDSPGPTRMGWNATQRRVLPTLERLGVHRLAFVVATHPHADHIGGIPAVLRQIPVGAIWHPGIHTPAPEWAAIRRLAARRSIPLRIPRDTRVAGVQIQVLSPRNQGRVGPHPLRSENDNSLVLRLLHPGGCVLLTGDLEKSGEAALLRARPDQVTATVLKVGHHGSRTSTTRPFLKAVAPRLAIISAPGPWAGPRAPSPDVLTRLRRAGAIPLVTGRQGHVTVWIAPWGLRVESDRMERRLPPFGWKHATGWSHIESTLRLRR